MTNPTPTPSALTRRAVLACAAAVGVTSALVACGDDDDAPSGTSGGSGTAQSATVKVADVPVGGGAIVPDQRIVVTQPTGGTFKAFSAACTHQGCIVSSVKSGKIVCACHGSEFSITDGSVLAGPASRALPTKTVAVNGDSLTIT